MAYNQRERQKKNQSEVFGERKTSIVSCYTTLLVHCTTAQMTTAITHAALKAEANCEKTLARFSFVLKLK